MLWKTCKAKYFVSAVLIAIFFSFFFTEVNDASQKEHQDGTVYCINADNIEITANDLESFKIAGTLEENISALSNAQIRYLGTWEIYEGGFEKVDVDGLRNLSVTSDSVSVPVDMIVKRDAPEEGAIRISVTVSGFPEEPEEPPVPDPEEPAEPPELGPEDPVKPPEFNQEDLVKPPEFNQEKSQESLQPPVVVGKTTTKQQTDEAERITEKSHSETEAEPEEEEKISVERKVSLETNQSNAVLLIDKILIGSCVGMVFVYMVILLPDIRLIRWFNRKKNRKVNGN